MLQTAVDLSRQWPQAILKVALGGLYVGSLATWLSGSNLNWIDEAYSSYSSEITGSLIYSGVFFLGFLYLLGTIFVAAGETNILGSNINHRIKLGADVFETGNGLLINQYQEARLNAQMFGGILSAFFFASLTAIAISLYQADEARYLNEIYGVGHQSNEVSQATQGIGVWRAIGVSLVLVIAFFVAIKAVKRSTEDTYIAIAVQTELLLTSKNSAPANASAP